MTYILAISDLQLIREIHHQATNDINHKFRGCSRGCSHPAKERRRRMDELLKALGPAFAASFAIQRLLEVLDPILSKVIKDENKKIVFGLISLIIGLVFAIGAPLYVLKALGVGDGGLVDAIVTALIISVGTEGLNSILKFLGYVKDEKRAEAKRAQLPA
jgi:hypothetical protein